MIKNPEESPDLTGTGSITPGFYTPSPDSSRANLMGPDRKTKIGG